MGQFLHLSLLTVVILFSFRKVNHLVLLFPLCCMCFTPLSGVLFESCLIQANSRLTNQYSSSYQAEQSVILKAFYYELFNKPKVNKEPFIEKKIQPSNK